MLLAQISSGFCHHMESSHIYVHTYVFSPFFEYRGLENLPWELIEWEWQENKIEKGPKPVSYYCTLCQNESHGL